MIYLIATSDKTACKVGYTKNVEARLSVLRNGNHLSLDLIATRDGNACLEKAIHDRMSSRRLRGEWYAFDNEVVAAFFATYDMDKDLHPAKPNEVKQTRETLGLTQAQLGEKLGLDGSMISKMESGTLLVGPRTALALEALLARAQKEEQ